MYKQNQGFTLLELMSVVTIISILAMAALPNYTDHIKRAKISEGLSMATGVTRAIADYYAHRGKFPHNNQEANVADDLVGNHVKRIQIEEGVIQITFDDPRDMAMKGALSLRPAVVTASATQDLISWVCGYAQAAPGMTVIGMNKTNLNPNHLPSACR